MTTDVAPSTFAVPLESGDRLTRAEFERRYSCRPDIKKAELVEGVVYVASPVRAMTHGHPNALVVFWLMAYEARTPGVLTMDNATVRLDPDNELQPDAMLFHSAPNSGRERLSDDDYVQVRPELVIEVSASSASYDLHDKLRVYRRNGVREYLVWQMLENRLDWFRLADGEYVRIEPNAQGIIESDVFPGLRLHVPSLLAQDVAGVLKALEPAAEG